MNWFPIEVLCDAGASMRGAAEGPSVFKNKLSTEGGLVLPPGLVLQPQANAQPKCVDESLAHWLSMSEKVRGGVLMALNRGQRPLVLSGDHSLALGTIAGLRSRFANRVGVIWIDAHADLHTPFTSHSMNPHGMTLGAALRADELVKSERTLDPSAQSIWQNLKNLNAKQKLLAPQDLAYVGLRDFEAEEMAVIESQGISHFNMATIQSRGVQRVAEALLQKFSGYQHLYVSLDVDALDAKDFSATGLPTSNGILLPQLADLMQILLSSPKVVAVEVAEINPTVSQLGLDELAQALGSVLKTNLINKKAS